MAKNKKASKATKRRPGKPADDHSDYMALANGIMHGPSGKAKGKTKVKDELARPE